MLTVRKYLWFALIAAVSVWILYVAWNSASFQACIANKQSQQSQESLSELLRFFEIKARVGTDCFFVFLYDSRDAVTAVATAFIAIFTLTLWWATWGLLTHGREIERAYVSGGGPHDLATRIFQLQVNNYGKTPAIMTAVGIGFCELKSIPRSPLYMWAATQGTYKPGDHGRPVGNFAIPTLQEPVVYGRFRYIDIWRKSHVSSFILVLHPDGILPTSISGEYTFWN
jgi:hypothetical protein